MPNAGRWTLSVGCWTLLSLLLLSGCLSPRPGVDTPQSADVAVLGVQYAVSTGKDPGYNTLEVYLSNRGTRAVQFTSGLLDGEALPSLNRGALELLSRQFSISLDNRGASSAISLPLPPPDKHVTWWQFYPSQVAAPGETICCQINFPGPSPAARQLELRRENGAPVVLPVPRFSQPRERITAVTRSLDGKRVYVQYQANGTTLASLKINRRPVRSPALLAPAKPGLPEAAVVDMSKAPLRQGATMLVELDFANGTTRRALIRAVSGIMLDAPRGWETDKTLPARTRAKYHLDADPAIAYLPFDVICGDTHAKRRGAGAPAVAAARRTNWSRLPDRLCGVEFCTALYDSAWNIYAPIADAVFTKPYQLHWGPDPARFIENEESVIQTAIEAAAPCPSVWIPERFKRNRHVEGRELRLMAWMALCQGVKGIRYHYWMNDMSDPFGECPDLGEAMQAVNGDIQRLEPILGPLLPVQAQADRRQQIKVYEGWSGDRGILLLVRNMRYATDNRANDNGRAPRFRATPAAGLSVAVDLPPWITPAPPCDPLANATYACSREGRRLLIEVPELQETRLIWLENHGRAAARVNERITP